MRRRIAVLIERSTPLFWPSHSPGIHCACLAYSAESVFKYALNPRRASFLFGLRMNPFQPYPPSRTRGRAQIRPQSNGGPTMTSGTTLPMTLLAVTTSLAILEYIALLLITVGFGWLVTHFYTNQ
jgi:hypothetical protein